MTELDVDHLRTFGFVILRRCFDPAPLADELDRALARGPAQPGPTPVARVQYVPMMGASTPHSVALAARLEPIARALLEGPVLPVRAKGMRYFGSTPWHQDSTQPVASLGLAAYLEPLTAGTGALRVVPGSHRGDYARAVVSYFARAPATAPIEGVRIDALPGLALETAPGDVIAFDEHLLHASSGGSTRRQWRVDYLRAPAAAEAAAVHRYFAGIFAPDWDGGYDVDAFPSYPAEWLQANPAAAAQLRTLGVLELAATHEQLARARRPAR